MTSPFSVSWHGSQDPEAAIRVEPISTPDIVFILVSHDLMLFLTQQQAVKLRDVLDAYLLDLAKAEIKAGEPAAEIAEEPPQVEAAEPVVVENPLDHIPF